MIKQSTYPRRKLKQWHHYPAPLFLQKWFVSDYYGEHNEIMSGTGQLDWLIFGV